MTIPKFDIRARFGAAIRERRREIGITQEELADRAQLHRTYVGDIERGLRNVSLRNIERLAIALDISVSELFVRYKVEEDKWLPPVP